MNKDNFCLLQNNTSKDYNASIYKQINIYYKNIYKIPLTKVSNANIYKYKQFDISYKIKIILRKKFLAFKTQGLYCHELIFSKWVNLQKPRY